MNKFDETMKMVVVDEGGTPHVEQHFKDLDASAGIAAHEHTRATGHTTFIHRRRGGEIEWECNDWSCPA